MFSFLKDVMRTDASLQAVAVDEKTKLARVMCELFVEAAHVDEGMDPEEACDRSYYGRTFRIIRR